MRWGKPVDRPLDGCYRTFQTFLWWPLTIRGQTRWLEWADLEYRYDRCCYDEDEWVLIRFVNP